MTPNHNQTETFQTTLYLPNRIRKPLAIILAAQGRSRNEFLLNCIEKEIASFDQDLNKEINNKS